MCLFLGGKGNVRKLYCSCTTGTCAVYFDFVGLCLRQEKNNYGCIRKAYKKHCFVLC